MTEQVMFVSLFEVSKFKYLLSIYKLAEPKPADETGIFQNLSHVSSLTGDKADADFYLHEI